MKLEYVNGHFSVANNTRGFTYSTVEYVNLKEYNDDDDGSTVTDKKFNIFNNINTNSRFNYGAIAADATVVAYFMLMLQDRLLVYVENTHTRCVPYFTSFLTVPLMSCPAF